MPDLFDPAMHKRLKGQLNHNLRVLRGLHNQSGLKLRFDPALAQLAHDRDGEARTAANQGAADKNSAKSKNLFEYPILVTLYECRKLGLKIDYHVADRVGKTAYAERLRDDADHFITPTQAFADALAGLRYLKEVTYDRGFKSLFKGGQRDAIAAILARAAELQAATTRPQIDGLIASWVPFIAPDDVKLLVRQAIADAEVKRLLRDASRPGTLEEVAGRVYGIYKSGGHAAGGPTGPVTPYLRAVEAVARTNAAVAHPQSLYQIDGRTQATVTDVLAGRAYSKDRRNRLSLADPEDVAFVHFFRPGVWTGRGQVRIYLHLQEATALTALGRIFDVIAAAPPLLRAAINEFKMATPVLLSKYMDSALVWLTRYEDATALAGLLQGPLAAHLVDGLPLAVKKIGRGIGISTEPEVSFDPRFQAQFRPTKAYSYGTHRCEVIAEGLIAAVQSQFSFPDLNRCLSVVALKFSEKGVEFLKPYHVGSLP